MPKISIIIPVFNEEDSLKELHREISAVAEVNQYQVECVFVDDGSTDRTAEEALKAGARVVSLPFNVGVGGAMRTAFLYAQREGFEAVVQVDADGQHDPSDLGSLFDGLHDADIVVGSRFHPDSMYFVGGPRKWAMVLLSRALSRMNKSPISITTSGRSRDKRFARSRCR